MGKWVKKVLSVLLAFVLVVGFAPLGAVTVSAASASDLATTIETFAHGGTGTLTATASGNEVTVTGSVTGVVNTLSLDIDAGVTVVWKAVYKGSRDLLMLEGPGMFEVAAGANVDANQGTAIYADTSNITVTGGTVRMYPLAYPGAKGYAIHAVSSHVTVAGGNVRSSGSLDNLLCSAIYLDSSTLTVSGGSVSHDSKGHAITAVSSTVTVTDGTVRASNGGSNAIKASVGSNITVSGGEVTTAGDFTFPGYTSNAGSDAISADASDITVTGGRVIANSPQYSAISASSGSVRVMGGSVIGTSGGMDWPDAGAISITGSSPVAAAYLKGTCSSNLKVSGSGQIVEVDSLAIPACHDGTDIGLTMKAGTGTATWDCTGTVPVIAFSNGKTIEWGEMTPHTPGSAATCTEDQVCTICQTILEPKKGHNPGAAATCTTAQVCTVCTTVIESATGHTYGTDWSNDATTHWHECACGDKSDVATHTPGPTATCTTAQVCTVCTTVLAPATGHSYSTVWSNDATNHWHECNCGDKSDVAAHTPSDWIIDKAPTITEAGSKHKACTACGLTTATETIPATGSPHTVTVNGGTGSGTYSPGQTVAVTAKPSSSFFTGQTFKNWTASGVTLSTPGNASTSFTMPNNAVAVTAQYDTMIRLWGKTTGWASNFGNWLLCIVCFGWIWMAF